MTLVGGSGGQRLEGDDKVEVGIIGMGDMGRLYAAKINAAGWM
jgi:phosphoglycerate dehydrogenase-like enzyme